jgi:chemotaxis protein MotB
MSGGAWKVAYADFVTAMMALFMVLWILGSEQETLEELQEYFRNPPSPWDQASSKYVVDTGDYYGFSKQNQATEDFFNSPDPAILEGILSDFNTALQAGTFEDAPPVKMTLTSDGLRMVIFDRENTPMFNTGGLELTDWGQFLLQNLAWLLTRYDFKVTIDAHCEAGNPGVSPDYGPWELTSDRANKVRRELVYYAGEDIGIGRVSGYGATRPPGPDEGDGATHQRIIVSLSLPDPVGKQSASPSPKAKEVSSVDSLEKIAKPLP